MFPKADLIPGSTHDMVIGIDLDKVYQAVVASGQVAQDRHFRVSPNSPADGE